MRENGFLSAAVALLASCAAQTEQLPVSQGVSRGLKIFVTAQAHGGDFANDPSLTGANAIAKADAFCNSDPAKPDAATYKALLVDGVHRDAKKPVDWVLRASTPYFQPLGDVLIDTTTAAAILGAARRPLANPIAPSVNPLGGPPPSTAWTGIGSAADFATGSDCNAWSDPTNSSSAHWGIPTETNGAAFSAGQHGCYYFQYPIYCVEQ